MKKITNKTALFTALVLTVFTGILIYSLFNIKGSTTFESSSETWSFPEMDKDYSDTAFGGLFAYSSINDSLPHYEYEKQKREHDLFESEMKRQNEGISSSGWNYGSIGFRYADLPSLALEELKKNKKTSLKYLTFLDSLSNLIRLSNDSSLITKYQNQMDSASNSRNTSNITTGNDTDQVYYASLKGFTKKNFHNRFFIQNNRYFMAEAVIDSAIKSARQTDYFAHYKRTELPYRYNEKEGLLQKPISKSVYRFLEGFNILFIIVGTFLIGYFLIGLFLQLLFNIAKGRVFTDKNISNLTAMMITMLIYCCVAIAAPYIFKWLLFSGSEKFFRSDLLFNSISENVSPIIITITLYAIRVAFKKGYKLQQEQSLTI